MKEIIEKLNVVLDSFMKDANAQIESSNKSAGIRARKTSLEIEKLNQDFNSVNKFIFFTLIPPNLPGLEHLSPGWKQLAKNRPFQLSNRCIGKLTCFTLKIF